MHCHTGYYNAMRNSFIMSRITRAVLGRIARFNLKWLIRNHAKVMLWVSLSAGGVATGRARGQFITILQAAVRELSLNSFEGAASICSQILWGPGQQAAAEELWSSAFESEFYSLEIHPFKNSSRSKDETMCIFCGLISCASPLRRHGAVSAEMEVPASSRGALWGTSVQEIRLLCNQTWYEVDKGFDDESFAIGYG